MISKKKNKSIDLVKVAALLIHSAKIDQDYSDQEEEIIRKTIFEISGKNENIEEIIKNAKKIEENSNQILEFTQEIKNMDEADKITIIETIWRIIYSNKEADIYETNLMRRLGGLLYIDNKIMGNIKLRIKKENS